eukprot:13303199-Alexandrium_andersonii.AAC.1
MAAIALAAVPWLRLLRRESPYTRPRVLADDLLVVTGATSELTDDALLFVEHENALEVTLAYFRDMGARVAPAKCKTFASSSALRARAKRYRPRGHGAPFEVVCHGRDLGAHLNFAQRAVGPTLTARLREATRTALTMAKMPAPYPARLNVVAGKIVPQALYGCQATPVAAAPLR